MADVSILADLAGNTTSNRMTFEEQYVALRLMLRIRQFEVRAKELFLDGVIKGTAHSSVGQEAIAAGACAVLEPEDFLLTHHRGHGHTLAKGADMGRMFAELMGKQAGYCAGIGGSMHIADVERNILGANGIIGAGMGLGTGAALAAKLDGQGQIGISFFGDGAANEGIFHEAMNLAAIWKLPLIFFCENNQYGLSTPTEMVTAGPSIAARGNAYGVPNTRVDGNDVGAVRQAMEQAALRARDGEGPTLIEALTYRWDDHSMRANLPAYRTSDEEDAWRSQDPIIRLRDRLIQQKQLDQERYDETLSSTHVEVEAAIDWAAAQAEPSLEDAAELVSVPSMAALSVLPAPGERKLTYKEAINEAFHLEMAHDEGVILLGEDIGHIGGIFGLTVGLIDAFGPERVRDTPISEGAIATWCWSSPARQARYCRSAALGFCDPNDGCDHQSGSQGALHARRQSQGAYRVPWPTGRRHPARRTAQPVAGDAFCQHPWPRGLCARLCL